VLPVGFCMRQQCRGRNSHLALDAVVQWSRALPLAELKELRRMRP
jgi:hypothetical protein